MLIGLSVTSRDFDLPQLKLCSACIALVQSCKVLSLHEVNQTLALSQLG